jgi:energy-coupling factor transport system permease protein
VNGRLLFYRRLASPLHATRAGVGVIWSLSLMVSVLVLFHPVALLALLLAALCAAAGAGVGRQIARSLRAALLLCLPIVLINVLVSRQGLTVFARLGDLGPFGQGDLTVEALLYGAVIALKVTVLIATTSLASLTVDPDESLRILRRLSFRSALTASLATRMIPVLLADSQRMSEAQRTRPEGASSGARARLSLIAAVVTGSLDRAMDVAATLELRGFSTARRAPRVHRPWSRHDLAFLASALAILALSVVGRLTGALAFTAYPAARVPLGPGTVALCIAIMAAASVPFADRRGIDP